ncbi:hypothetical protein Agabi119p4_931 [Agaricus bisporus var. burnettii]|uniref:Rhodanese domain-containing protein n=1 Tax=Agaricus bisporus var. burnettii TaxID=192524 RepID=A0A8H7KLF7_AGABI|nr:hypothetical protein AGABI2DRAFT_190035 [Agaricus bisporus var. bisporus H97]EKV51822.1 hypothetical protein AGABI2DRAFT_190035 [Agaricus bisporus var. bisporus H97]KAF7784766.1 hypothetical protein Agabi119p4_931 [Agaricus bisporus var. burnettii]
MASILRSGLLRNSGALARRRVTARVAARPAFTQFLRFNSSEPVSSSKPPLDPEKVRRKQALERHDDLQRDWDAKIMSYDELLPVTESPTSETYLIDVREPGEVVQGMIPSAVNLPLTVLAESLTLPPDDFKAKFGYSKPTPEKQVIFYCRSGMRSASACDVAKRNGFTNILNYKGSWLEWTEKRNNAQKSSA